jgi:hypothetical protein
MTKIRLKYAIPEFGGTLYEVKLNRFRQEEEIDTKRHRPSRPCNGKASEAQKAQRQLFKEAVAYAKAAMADPDLRAMYARRAAKENSAPYRIAFSDYMHGKVLLSSLA